jgi:hypothetical protein
VVCSILIVITYPHNTSVLAASAYTVRILHYLHYVSLLEATWLSIAYKLHWKFFPLKSAHKAPISRRYTCKHLLHRFQITIACFGNWINYIRVYIQPMDSLCHVRHMPCMLCGPAANVVVVCFLTSISNGFWFSLAAPSDCMEQSPRVPNSTPSWESQSLPFMEPRGSLPSSQEPAIFPYRTPD